MTTNTLKFYIAAICLISNFIMLAQVIPGNEDNNGDLNGTDPAAPIDGSIWVLAAIGLVFVFMKVRAFTKQGNLLNK